MSFSDPFSKFVQKFGDSKKVQEEIPEEDTTKSHRRSRSPFIMLLSDGNEEFNFNQSEEEFNKEDSLDMTELYNMKEFEGSTKIDSSSGNVSAESCDLANKSKGYEGSVENLNIRDLMDNVDESVMNDQLRSHRNEPLIKEQFVQMFDPSGRLVNEHELRKAIFKGGVCDDIRKEVWQFLFELYPFNSTVREREVLTVEQTVRYEAMKIRWKILLIDLVNDYEGVKYCPKWYRGCPENADEFIEHLPQASTEVSYGGAESSLDIIQEYQATKNKPVFEMDQQELKEVVESSDRPLNISNDDKKSNLDSFQCRVQANADGEQSDITVSEALADAMMELEDSRTLSLPKKPPLCKCDSFDLVPPEPSRKVYGSFDLISQEPSPRSINSFDLLTRETNIDRNLVFSSESDSFLSEELESQPAINLQESLYSKSENFKSIDLNDLEGPKIDQDATHHTCSPSKAETGEQNAFSVSFELETDVRQEETPQLKVHTLKTFVDLGDNFIQNENSFFKPIQTGCDLDESLNGETENEDSISNPQPMHSKALNTPYISANKKLSLSLDDMQLQDNFLAPSEDIRDCAKSPTGESLETLPPWIAQMIRASTPPHKNTPQQGLQRTRSEIKLEHKKRYPVRKRHSVSGESVVSPLNRDLIHDKNLLGIVENANKYLIEQMQLQKTRASSSAPTTPFIKKQSAKKHVVDSNTSSIDMSLGLNETPKFKFVSDNVDNKPKSENVSYCPYCDFKPTDVPRIHFPSSLGTDQLKFMEIQAQVFAARQPYDEKNISASIRVIDKDVPRTDRDLPQFSGDSNPGLIKLRDALLTYAFFHPEVGYAQGMNDIMGRFLVVMDTEAQAYWMFVNYMEHFKNDFMEEGMLRKVVLVEQLLMKMDRELFDFLQLTDMGLMFCHRWLLLNFKREFKYKEAIQLFEITSSRHLEVSSLEAEMERSKERAKEFVKDNAGSHMEEVYMSPEYPFDIFVCVAMLMECRDVILQTSDDLSAIYQLLSNLPTSLDLQTVLKKSEEIFYQYCRKSVVDCFQVIDEGDVNEDKKKWFSFR